MKQLKFIPVFFVLLNSFTSQSQDIQNLDTKYGFKKFKLESSYDLYKSQLKLIQNQEKKAYYEFTGTEYSEIFGYKVNNINLCFYKNKLYEISIEYDLKTEEYKTDIIRHLESLFGTTEQKFEDSVIEWEPKEYGWNYFWEGKKTLLNFSKDKKERYAHGPTSISILIRSKVIKNQIANDEF